MRATRNTRKRKILNEDSIDRDPSFFPPEIGKNRWKDDKRGEVSYFEEGERGFDERLG